MNPHAPTDIPPTAHNAKDKYDALDWQRIPAGTAEMNYRLRSGNPLSNVQGAIFLIMSTTTICLVLRWLLAAGPAQFVTQHTSLLMFACVAALWGGQSLRSSLPGKGKTSAMASLISVLGIWLLLVLLRFAGYPPLVLATFVTAGACCIGLFADQVATHYVFWMSANPRVPRATMWGWRGDWHQRFLGMADRPSCQPNLTAAERQHFLQTMRLRRFYPWAFAILVGALVLAATLGLLGAHLRGVRGATVVIALESVAILLAVALVYRLTLPESTQVFFGALGNFFSYGKNLIDPPWVFHSPVGDRLTRRVWLIAATAIVTMLVATLTMSQGLQLWFPTSPRSLAIRFAVLSFIVPGMVAPLLVVVGAFVATAPTLVAYHRALEAKYGHEQHLEWTDFDGYVDRLRTSNNAIEARSNIIGFHPIWEFPVLADTDLYLEHQHVLGSTGTGKTALSVTTDLIQLIRRGDGPVIVVDCKGDRALFETTRMESERCGRKFKWFTNKPHRSTYIFNPLAHLSSPQFTLPEVLGVLLQSFNLFHGDEYGRAYFGKAVRILLRAAYLATTRTTVGRRGGDSHATGYRTERIESFWDLDDILQEITANEREYEAAKHLAMLVQSLCDFDQLNLTASRDPNEPAVHHAISMPEVIRDKQVIYFYLVGTMDQASVGEIARLALFATNSAAVQYRDQTNKRPRIYFIADEAQCLLAKNVETVLQQARDSGIGFLLAHQSLSQLNLAGGVDLTPQIMNSTCIKRYHASRDVAAQKYISEISGTTKYYLRSWKQFKHRVLGGNVSPRYACTDADHVMRIDISEQLGPRLEPEDIRDINRDINQSVVIFERNSGYSQFLGAFPMTTQWPMPKDENDQRAKANWPVNDDETITITGAWPESNDETIVPTSSPDSDLIMSPEDLDKSLREVRRLLSPDEE